MGWFGGKAPPPEPEPAPEPPKESPALQSDMTALLTDNIGPITGQISMGAVFGYCSGYALQKAGSVAAIMVGAGFTFIQGLAYYGYIDVNWQRVQGDFVMALDFDGDGEVTMEDARAAFQHLEKVLLFNLPAGAGFTTGLMYGMGGHARTAGKVGLAYGLGGQLLRGMAATTAPAMMSLPYEAYINVKQHVSEYIEEPFETRVAKFKVGILEKGMEDLREMEKAVREELKDGKAHSQQFAEAKLHEIEQRKKELKKSSWWFW